MEEYSVIEFTEDELEQVIKEHLQIKYNLKAPEIMKAYQVEYESNHYRDLKNRFRFRVKY